jgi:hypothetical protein
MGKNPKIKLPTPMRVTKIKSDLDLFIKKGENILSWDES